MPQPVRWLAGGTPLPLVALVLLLVVKGYLYSFTVKLSGKYACFIIIFIIHINIVYFEAEISFACIYSVKLYLY